MKTLVYVILIVSLMGCKNKKTHNNKQETENTTTTSTPSSESDEQESSEKYPDGTYCADVEYYNPNTGTRHTYQLNVDVEDGELSEIHWPNGGWLDESHFSPEELDENGEASFTSDKGYQYDVTITSNSPCMYSKRQLQSLINTSKENELDKYGKETGTVVWQQSGCRYIIIAASGWYVVAENDWLSVGDRLRGNLTTYGYEDVYNLSGGSEVNLYIDYYGSKSSAMERVKEKCNLTNDEDDQ